MSDAPLLAPVYLGGPVPDTENCAREPIHIPGSVQPHGALMVLGLPGLEILQVSANSRVLLGAEPQALLGRPLAEFSAGAGLEELSAFLGSLPEVPAGARAPQHVGTLAFTSADGNRRVLDMTAHLSRRADDSGAGRALLELEPPDPAASATFYQRIKNALSALEEAPDLPTLCDRAAREVRALTGFDRVMIYRFAADDSGEVVAEARTPELHPFLGQRFPESDIPRQARALYVQNLLRLTADVDAPPAPLVPLLDPQTGEPVNLASAVLRSTSPLHLQYLRNMGVASSLSVSVVQGGRLWGLISCHHSTPKIVPQTTRSALEFLGRVLTLQVRAKQEADIHRFRAGLRARQLSLLSLVSSAADPFAALATQEAGLLPLMSATGAALYFGGEFTRLGDAPGEAQLHALLGWLRGRGRGADGQGSNSRGDDGREGALYATESLSAEWPGGEGLTREASGVLAISISGASVSGASVPGTSLPSAGGSASSSGFRTGGGWDEAVLWFRPEVPQTVAWGGNPEKPVEQIGDGFKISPRRSFETYLQTVRGRSEPWHPGELEEARDLRGALASALAERVAALRLFNTQLTLANRQLEAANREWRQYGFVLSHDLQEPLRLISNFLGLLSSRYGDQLDGGAVRVVDYTLAEAGRLRGLIRDLYDYTELSGLGSSPDGGPGSGGTGQAGAAPALEDVDLNTLMTQLREQLGERPESGGAQLEAGPLPTVQGDPQRLARLLHALLDNALKFTSPGQPARVRVSAAPVPGGWQLSVRDEGLGIAPEHHERIFMLFQRLNRREHYLGSGIGLTLARRLAELHGGTLSVDSQLGAGSTFILTLPDAARSRRAEVTAEPGA